MSMLQRYGKVVTFPFTKAVNSNTENLAEYIEERVKSVTGLSLDAYRV